MASILVADDETSIRMLIAEVLSMHGYETEEAHDGLEALQLCNEKHHELLITDLVMPGKEGLEVIAEIKRQNPSQRIIAITGGGRGSSLGYAGAARAIGADLVLAKPFAISELVSAVEALLPHEHEVSAIS